MHLLFTVSSVESPIHRLISESHALRNGAFVHNCGYLLEENAVLALNLCELVLLDHFTLFVVDHDNIAFNSVTSHWSGLFKALIVFL